MLDLNSLRLVRLADVPVGHLLYCEQDGVRRLGLRVNAMNAPPELLACPLCFDVEIEPNWHGSVMLAGMADSTCIHLGAAVFLADSPRVAEALRPGGNLRGNELLLTAHGLVLAGWPPGGRNNMRFWTVSNGNATIDTPNEFLVIRDWCLGVRDGSGGFVELYRRQAGR
jgi:hypothetical protein